MTDWVRLPVTPEDVTARVDALDRYVRQWMPPRVDEYDVVWRGDAWTALAPIEATIVRVLFERSPRVVSRELGVRTWPDGTPAGRPVDRRLRQLRTRLAPLGLRVQTIRQRGLLLVVDAPEPADPAGSG
jgi:DNA-binding response OmpR family regulator